MTYTNLKILAVWLAWITTILIFPNAKTYTSMTIFIVIYITHKIKKQAKIKK